MRKILGKSSNALSIATLDIYSTAIQYTATLVMKTVDHTALVLYKQDLGFRVAIGRRFIKFGTCVHLLRLLPPTTCSYPNISRVNSRLKYTMITKQECINGISSAQKDEQQQ